MTSVAAGSEVLGSEVLGPEVLDASALLAWLQLEPGAGEVVLEGALMNSVNWSEVLQKAAKNGVAVEGIQEELEALGLQLQGFNLAEAAKAADLYKMTHPYGLSLADRACLATAHFVAGTVVTADREWANAEHGVPVRLIR